MITGLLQNFERRCRERGYTLEEVRACIVYEDGDWITVDETSPAYPRAPKPGVSIVQRASNFTRSAVRYAAAGLPNATDAEIERRWAICQQCEHMTGGRCQRCGCPIVRERRLLSKLAWATESCPVGKWGPVGLDRGEISS